MRVHFDRPKDKIGKLEILFLLVLQRKNNVKQWILIGIALRMNLLDQFVKRQFLMGKSAQHIGSNFAQYFLERRQVRHLAPDGQGIHEKSKQVFDL